jgi:hypothetical protein
MTQGMGARGRLIVAWTVVAVTWVGAVVTELMLLPEHVALAVPLTTVAATGLGVLVTRRLSAHREQPIITVQDLRRRR